MGIIHERYKQLKPELRYLYDEAVLAQAWKKSHAYIRSHNWYADTLELDCSAVNLQERIKEWGKELKEQTYTPSKMRMVPAPKTDHWTFYRPEICVNLDKCESCLNSSRCDKWKWGPNPKDGKPVAFALLICKENHPGPF